MFAYYLLDWFFVLFHLAVVLFNLFAWIPRKTRRWNLYLLLVTGLCWFGFGIFYGWGYCPLTDWHFHVLYKLGRYPSETSYISYSLNRFFGLVFEPSVVDLVTVTCYLCALVISIVKNLFHRKR